jgi:hypothetical protein
VCVRFGDRKTAGQKMASFADGQISRMLFKLKTTNISSTASTSTLRRGYLPVKGELPEHFAPNVNKAK